MEITKVGKCAEAGNDDVVEEPKEKRVKPTEKATTTATLNDEKLNVQQKTKKKNPKYCLKYINNSCDRGEDCEYNHDLEVRIISTIMLDKIKILLTMWFTMNRMCRAKASPTRANASGGEIANSCMTH